jgi:hypothetical protein
MRQRGRKSQAQLATSSADITGKPAKLKAPEHLNEAEGGIFTQVIDAVEPAHFSPVDAPLVAIYSQAVAVTQRPARDEAWERAVKLVATLGTRLRLTPQSRYDARAAARHQGTPMPRPWEI